ncbi:nucleotide-diphospho-sugar transferase [Kockiozyma suomiensis]|uniref:nucleotide-diphospho-sugar transferase n=1 Tax=Kockiozyma suomiensis TaxID=1337062 RepID=UPI0033431130
MRFKIVSLTALALVALWMMAMKYYQISSSAHTIPVRQLSPLPTFTKVTVYRSDPDIIFENYLDAGLVKLKLSYLSTSNTAAWPMKIFQTARKIDPKYKDAISSWSAYNPQYEHMLLNDKASTELVERAYLASPEIIDLYKSFPNPVLKADLLRYLLLYLYGGVYADVDVYCRKPINEWIPESMWASDADVIVGIEIDEPYFTSDTQRQWQWHRPYSFAQYTIAAKPFAKPIRTAIVRVVAHAHHLARLKKKSSPSKISKYSAEDVFEVSGPGMWTDSIFDAINFKKKGITWAQMTELRKLLQFPTESGSVIILPIQYFGNGQAHSNAGDFTQPEACVSHLFTKDWQRNSWF